MGEKKMIDELREEEIVKKVGGRFKLSTLIQKRLVAINGGARPLVNTKSDNKMQIVVQEILQDKIYLDTDLNVKIAGGQPATSPIDLDFDAL
jgi:DNA-directed RNA polymerase subunit omega